VTGPENFVSRWARLKRKSGSQRRTELVRDTPQLSTAEVSAAGAEADIARPRVDVAADEPFDLSSLPSIEAITANTDIRGFLQSRVPAELTRAALRQAWASDPAIRDFIGIAENQWDFNDPTAIPGFGPLSERDNVAALLTQALGGQDKLAEMIAEIPVSVEQSLPAVTDHEPAALEQDAQQTSESSPATNSVPGSPDDGSGDRVAEADDPPRNRRSHGGALPR
jgi:hypothetical protein